ncbi:MAG: hypothetical protein ISS17_04305 [Bacteroidales bacterium]|nr:hypothetical protein [Bacteroidales bacterium]
MKRKSFLTWPMVVFLVAINGMTPLFSQSKPLAGDTLIRVAVKVNDTLLTDSLYLRILSAGPQVEAKEFMRMVGGTCIPFSHLFRQDGLMVQYGRFISFSRLGFTKGFVNLQLAEMVPPVSTRRVGTDSLYFAPLDFLAQAIGGTVVYDAIAGMLQITKDPPPGFAALFPPAADVAQALSDSGYTVQQGEMTKQNPIDFCLGGYTPNANGNNVGAPYFGIQIPAPPDMDSLYSPPITFNFNADEAVVLIGRTPPECIYYSYRSYLMNRLYDFPPSATRTKINASLGETTSLYRMRPELPLDSMFGRKFALIMAGDSLVAMRVKNIILAATPEIPEADIHFDILPSEGMFRFGNNPLADWGSMLHRVAQFSDTAAQNNYLNNPLLEILRVSPNQPPQQVLFSLRSFLPRTCGTNEFALMPDMEVLEEGIYNMYHADYEIIWLQPSPWVIEGFVAIQQGLDALGDNHDALYIVSPGFLLRDNDIALAYGVDHTLTGKAVYTNLTIYQKHYMAGFGGITNTMMKKSARHFVSDTTIADKLYAWGFARHPVPGNPYLFVVPADTNHTLEGINLNDTAMIAYRLYVNTLTKIGADPMEVILDQAVLLRPFNTGIHDEANDQSSSAMKIYPNPVIERATLEFTVPEWSDVSFTMYNSSGQPVGNPIRVDHVRGTVLQEIRLSANIPSGICYIRGVVTEIDKERSYTLTSRMVLLGGTRQ